MKGISLFNLLFPPRCARCDSIPERRSSLCDDCRKLLILPEDPIKSCDICFMRPDRCLCPKHPYIRRLSVSFYYESEATRTVFKLKFRSRRDIAKNMAIVMCESLLQRNMLQNTDVITFIPMTAYSKFRRGYNQSELIARQIAVLADKPCIKLLYKFSSTDKQHSLSGIERTGNILGAFEPDKRHEEYIKDKRILVIDDVCTTGSTFNEIAKTLLIFGASEVYAASFTARKKQKKH